MVGFSRERKKTQPNGGNEENDVAERRGKVSGRNAVARRAREVRRASS